MFGLDLLEPRQPYRTRSPGEIAAALQQALQTAQVVTSANRSSDPAVLRYEQATAPTENEFLRRILPLPQVDHGARCYRLEGQTANKMDEFRRSRMGRELERRTHAPDESLMKFVRAMKEMYEYADPTAPNAERIERLSVQMAHRASCGSATGGSGNRCSPCVPAPASSIRMFGALLGVAWICGRTYRGFHHTQFFWENPQRSKAITVRGTQWASAERYRSEEIRAAERTLSRPIPITDKTRTPACRKQLRRLVITTFRRTRTGSNTTERERDGVFSLLGSLDELCEKSPFSCENSPHGRRTNGPNTTPQQQPSGHKAKGPHHTDGEPDRQVSQEDNWREGLSAAVVSDHGTARSKVRRGQWWSGASSPKLAGRGPFSDQSKSTAKDITRRTHSFQLPARIHGAAQHIDTKEVPRIGIPE
ncbi:hypothetical protein HPB50_027272 [Hyalomma asiaticum]|uniref:Uncharacterized protein n=1 Tax=Hyalomma asiaticum TaxID=266040 RepID=A0ACB7TS18_HYAAI|nr:hypothetical protein HPB50_027272 [Hyalomma asiaticum]